MPELTGNEQQPPAITPELGNNDQPPQAPQPDVAQADDDICPLTQLIATGQGPYEVLYQPNDDGQMEMKPLLARNAGQLIGVQITKEIIECTTFTSQEVMKGRNIHGRQLAVSRDFRKAESIIYKRIKKEDGSIKHSGKNWSDVINGHLDDMYALLNNVIIVDDSDDDDDNDDEDDAANTTATARKTTDKRPTDWVYDGFLAYMTFGPFPWCRHQRANLLNFESDPVGKSAKKKSSRKSARKEKEAHDAFERSRDSKRGKPAPSLTETLLQQVVEGRNEHSDRSLLEAKLITLSSRANRLTKLIGNFSVADPLRQEFMDSYKAVEKEIDGIMKEIDKHKKSGEQRTIPTAASAPAISAAAEGIEPRVLTATDLTTP